MLSAKINVKYTYKTVK